jgi:hypothetical protein
MGAASFANLDGYLAFDMEGDGNGHFTLVGEACREPGSSNFLGFRLVFDQTDIPPILRALDGALRAFPVVGTPPG